MSISSRATIGLALALAAQPAFAQETPTTMTDDATPSAPFEGENDPFIWLEEARSVPALSWVRSENTRVDQTLGADPRFAAL